MQQLFGADFHDGLKGGGEVVSIAVEHRRAIADRRMAQRREPADIEFVIKAPAAHGFPDPRDFRKAMRLAQLAKNRFVLVNRVGKGAALPVDVDQERGLIFTLQHAR